MKHTKERDLGDIYIRAEYGLTKIGEQVPYFSVTALIWNSLAHARRWPDNPSGGGAAHADVLRAFPDMADIVALHLSDIDGVPMYAQANGWYFYQRREVDLVAGLLRVAIEELPVEATEERFAAFVDAQRERWASEAAAVRAKYDL